MNDQRKAAGWAVWIDPKSGREIVPHGFRSTFRDWASEMTSFEEDVIEFSLSHVEGSKAKAAYKRSDLLEKRRLLMDAWAAYVSNAIPRGGVVNLNARRGQQ